MILYIVLLKNIDKEKRMLVFLLIFSSPCRQEKCARAHLIGNVSGCRHKNIPRGMADELQPETTA